MNQAVGLDTVERPLDFSEPTPNLIYLQAVAEQADYGDELYGLKLALEYGVFSPELATYLGVQELTHVQEGVELQQQDTTEFPFINGQTIDPITKRPMLAIAKNGHTSQKKALQEEKGFKFMVTRTEHDIAIAEDNNRRMQEQPVGSVWLRITPFAEEESTADARDAGFWTDTRRAFIWVYRKKSESVLEATIVSVDQSSVAAFAGLMHECGTDIPIDITSHDIPGFVIEMNGLVDDEAQRDKLMTGLKTRYKELARITEASGVDISSKAFIEECATNEIASLVRLQLEIINSLETNNLAPYVREAGTAALTTLAEKYLSSEEIRSIMTAINTSKPIEHIDDLRLIMKAHRYGVWETINSKIKAFRSGGSRDEFEVGADRVAYHGNAWSLQLALDEQLQRIGQEIDQTERAQLSRNATHAQNAAEQGKVKPGCSGGSGFLSQTESEAKESIFGGKENDPKRWMSCPFCKKKEAVKARVCDTNLKCRHCTAEVRGGKVVNTGNGGKAEVQPQPQETDSNIADIEKKRHEKIAAETQQGVTGEQSTKAVS